MPDREQAAPPGTFPAPEHALSPESTEPSARWWAAFANFSAWVTQHPRTFLPPKDFVLPDGRSIRLWVYAARQRWREGTLSDERRAALESVPGWDEFVDPPRGGLDAVHLGTRLLELRREAGLRAVDAAQSVGCSPSLITAIERGSGGQTPERMTALLSLYGASPSVTAELLNLLSLSRCGPNRVVYQRANAPAVSAENLAVGTGGMRLINERGLAQLAGTTLRRLRSLVLSSTLMPVPPDDAPHGSTEWYRLDKAEAFLTAEDAKLVEPGRRALRLPEPADPDRWITTEEYREMIGLTKRAMESSVRKSRWAWSQGQASALLALPVDPEEAREAARGGGRGRPGLEADLVRWGRLPRLWRVGDVVVHQNDQIHPTAAREGPARDK